MLASIATRYLDNGFNPVPLAAGTKVPVRKGVTGASKKNLSRKSVAAIRDGLNLGLRLPKTVIGLDWDAYKGAEAFENLIVLLGDLPTTYRSTSRTDGKSGIYLFTVPSNASFPGGIADCNVDIIKHTHRVAACYPSIHTSGAQYNWIYGSKTVTNLPNVNELPELPERWVQFLTAMTEIRKTGGAISITNNKVGSFSAKVSEFAKCSDGDRNNTMYQLARQGMWYEMSGQLDASQSVEMLVEAAFENGLVQDDTEEKVRYRIQHSRAWAEKHYDSTKVGSKNASGFDKTAIVNWNNSIQASDLSDNLKFAANVMASFSIEKEYSYVVMSTRALAEVCGVSQTAARSYFTKLEKKGWIDLTAGAAYSKELKTGRANVVNFNMTNVVEAEVAPLVGDVAEILQGYFDSNKTGQDVPSTEVLTSEKMLDIVVEKAAEHTASYEAEASVLVKLLQKRGISNA